MFHSEKLDKEVSILNSRFDGDLEKSVVEFVTIGDEVKVNWSYSMDNRIANKLIRERVLIIGFYIPSFDKSKMMTLRMKHPAITSDGDFVLKTHDGAIWKVDLCGKPIWVNTEFSFHHSTEIDDEGNIYVPGTKEGSSERYDHRVMDDFLVVLNSDGEVKFQKSILQILKKINLTTGF